MNKRGTGVLFCLISAMLFCTRHLAAAIFGSGATSWNEELFQAMLSYVGGALLPLSMVSLLIGLGYIIWAEISKEK